MAIDRDSVQKIAHLARLDFSEEEIHRYREQIGAILEHIDQLRKLSVDGVEPFAHAGDLTNVLREDAPGPSLPMETALANAPVRNGPYFVVPRIIEPP